MTIHRWLINPVLLGVKLDETFVESLFHPCNKYLANQTRMGDGELLYSLLCLLYIFRTFVKNSL